MLETTVRLKHQENSRFHPYIAFSGRLAIKTRENEARKALLLEASGQQLASIEAGSHSPYRNLIVVVDDEPHIAITLSETLELWGYRAVWFTEPVAPLALVRAHRPDVLFADVNTPMLVGFDLAVCLKRRHPDCRVMVTSALGNNPEFVKRIATAGVSVVLEAKPMQICHFLSKIAELILAGA
jgi:CheY-like chemotaxis protein